MALSDWTPSSGAPKSSVTQANDIPAPRPDSAVNAPPPDQHRRVIDFVKESPAARYSFDSRLNRDAEHAELCRIDARGNKSCIKLSMHSKALFKSMQGLGFYCALPAEPHRTDMQCDAMPKLS